MQAKLLGAEFTLEDFLAQMQQIKKMGPLQGLMGMIPGMGKALKDVDLDDGQLKQVESIIQSMTAEERRNHKLLNGKRKKRVAAGCGRSPQEINELLRSFEEMQKMMKSLGGARGMKAMRQLRNAPEIGGFGDLGEFDPAAMAGLGAGAPGGPGGGPGGGRPRNKNVPKRKKKKRR